MKNYLVKSVSVNFLTGWRVCKRDVLVNADEKARALELNVQGCAFVPPCFEPQVSKLQIFRIYFLGCISYFNTQGCAISNSLIEIQVSQ